MARDEAVLLDVVRAAQLVLEFRQGIDRVAFFDDLKTQSAILHQLMVMGEAVKRLSAELRARHPKVPNAYLPNLLSSGRRAIPCPSAVRHASLPYSVGCISEVGQVGRDLGMWGWPGADARSKFTLWSVEQERPTCRFHRLTGRPAGGFQVPLWVHFSPGADLP